MQSRSARAGLVVVLIVSLAYGYGLGLFVDSPYQDPCQGDPGFASFGLMVLGILAGAVILPAVSLVYIWLARASISAAGCFLVIILPVVAAAIGFWLFGALPLHHVDLNLSGCT